MLSFEQPLILTGLLTLAVPVLLHLLNRERPRLILFPAMRFLLRAGLPQQGRRRLRDLLLLLLRLLLLALIILALARPYRKTAPSTAAGSANLQIVVVADISASMGGWGRLERLRQELTRISEENRGAAIGLVFSGGRGDLSASALAPSLNHRQILAAAADIQATAQRGVHDHAISRAINMFSPGSMHELVLISDFQRSDWQNAGDGLVPAGMAVELIDVAGKPPLENAGIMNVRVVSGATGNTRVITEVRNFSSQESTRRITLRAGDFSAAAELTVPPGQSRKTAFSVDQNTASHGILELEPDAYTADDTYHFWLGPRPAVQVLGIAPLQQEPEKANELFFLRKALETRSTAASTGFNLETAEPDFFFALNLEPVRAILLLGAAGYFSAADFAKIKEFLETGGTVFVTPGAAAAHMFRGLRTAGLLTADFVERFSPGSGFARGADGPVTLSWLNHESVLGQVFREPAESGLFMFPLRNYARLRLADADAVTLLRSSQDNDPILLERAHGRGRLFISTMSFDLSGSDLPLTVAFVPLVLELMATAVPAGYGVGNLECGADISLTQSIAGENKEPVQDYSPENLKALTAGPGVFTINDDPFQVNVPRSESSLEQVLTADLLGRLRAEREVPGGVSARTEAGVAGTGTQIPLWHYFAMAAAVVFLVEMLLASFLDSRTGT